MFKAIRDSVSGFGHRLGAGWRELRARGMIRLFVFEFTVVLLGVLAAQGLANWFREREAGLRMESAVTQLDREVASAHHSALIWSAAVPCLRERVSDVMRAAANRGDVATDALARPLFWITRAQPVSEEVRLEMRVRLPAEVTPNYLDLIERVDSMGQLSTDLSRQWEQFARIDPALGQVSQGDRDAVRDAAGEIRSILLMIEVNSANIIDEAQSLGIAPEQITDIAPRRPARDCAELWHHRAIAVPVDGKLEEAFGGLIEAEGRGTRR